MALFRFFRSTSRFFLPLCLGLILGGCGGADDQPTGSTQADDSPEPVTRLASRPNNATCIAPAAKADTATLLSQTGCFSGPDTQTPAAGVIPYTVNTLLWSDGEKKGRYFAIPDGSHISITEDRPYIVPTTGVKNGNFDFPAGSVIIKHFYSGSRIIETRLLMRHANDGWAGYSYQWNDSQTDATLLTTSKQISSPVSHYFPSPEECMDCHTDAALVTLGPDTLQLNYNQLYTDGSEENMLDALERLGYFDTALASDYKQARLHAIDDDSADLEARVRSYLHGNCAGCHRTGGPAGGLADLRYNASFAPNSVGGNTFYNVCNAPQGATDTPAGATALIEPGDAAHSALYLRLNSNDVQIRMPPIGRATIDSEAVRIIGQWIDSLTGC